MSVLRARRVHSSAYPIHCGTQDEHGDTATRVCEYFLCTRGVYLASNNWRANVFGVMFPSEPSIFAEWNLECTLVWHADGTATASLIVRQDVRAPDMDVIQPCDVWTGHYTCQGEQLLQLEIVKVLSPPVPAGPTQQRHTGTTGGDTRDSDHRGHDGDPADPTAARAAADAPEDSVYDDNDVHGTERTTTADNVGDMVHFAAVLTFKHTLADGVYRARGRYNVTAHRMVLEPGPWIYHPDGFAPLGFSGMSMAYVAIPCGLWYSQVYTFVHATNTAMAWRLPCPRVQVRRRATGVCCTGCCLDAIMGRSCSGEHRDVPAVLSRDHRTPAGTV